MIDPVSAGIAALTSGSPLAVFFVFCAGVLSSIGPCVAPRYIAIAALANGPDRARAITAFITGLIGAYVAIGYVAGLLGSLWSYSRPIDLLLASALFAGGVVTVVRAEPEGHRCAARDRVRGGLGGGPFLLGAASSLVVSPCCMPMIAAVAATSSAIGHPVYGAMLLAVFGLGHALPLVFAAAAASATARLVTGLNRSQAPAIVSGSLMIALGCYYGFLA